MREHRNASFSLREKVPEGRMRVRRNGNAEECYKIQHSAFAMALRRTLTPTHLSPELPFGTPIGEGP